MDHRTEQGHSHHCSLCPSRWDSVLPTGPSPSFSHASPCAEGTAVSHSSRIYKKKFNFKRIWHLQKCCNYNAKNFSTETFEKLVKCCLIILNMLVSDCYKQAHSPPYLQWKHGIQGVNTSLLSAWFSVPVREEASFLQRHPMAKQQDILLDLPGQEISFPPKFPITKGCRTMWHTCSSVWEDSSVFPWVLWPWHFWRAIIV